jgi:hypothetical protein
MMTEEDILRFNESLASTINFYLSLYLTDEDLFYDSRAEDKDSEASALLFLYMFLQRYHDNFLHLAKDKNPFVVLPLLRCLLDSSLVLALAPTKEDVDPYWLAGKEEIDLFLTDEVKSFLRRFGEDRAKDWLKDIPDTENNY